MPQPIVVRGRVYRYVGDLQEAHAMEQNVMRMLDGMISTTDNPGMIDALEHHKVETERHRRRIEERLDAHGASSSSVLDVAGILGALAKLPVDMVRGEKAARNARDAFATEHLEIASYELLERIARQAGDDDTAKMARENRRDEEAMAEKLAQSWDVVVEEIFRAEGARQPAP
jgi:ferritin-like metal-binding protein YciE